MSGLQTRRGMALLGPRPRLFLVVLATSAFAFVQNLELAAGIFVVSVLVLLLGPPVRRVKFLLGLLLTNTALMLIGNALFSPSNEMGPSFLIFHYNSLGLHAGIIGALKRGSMLVLSFAWLSATTSADELVQSFSFFPGMRWRKYSLVFLKGIENLTVELTDFYRSILARGLVRRTTSPRQRLFQMYLVLNAMTSRFFRDVTRMTLAGESHFGEGQIRAAKTLETRGLAARYDGSERNALSGIDLKVEVDDVVCLVGNCEAGKTSLLRCLSGYIPRLAGEITDGEVLLGGHVVDDLSLGEIARDVQYIGSTQADNFVGLTVGQEMLAATPDESEAMRWCSRLGIGDLWGRRIATLSGGQQGRLLLASGVASGARCLLFDSPLSQLDEDGRLSLVQAVEELKAEADLVVVFADQTLDAYVGVANRFLFMAEGVIRADVRGVSASAEEVQTALGWNPGYTSPSAVVAPEDSEIVVALRDVVVELGGRRILDRMTLEVRKGECLGIVGRNGSGKTTAVLTLAGLIRPTNGTRLAPNRTFGVVFQNPERHLLETRCDRELRIGPRLRGWDRDSEEQFVTRSIDILGVSGETPTLDLHPVRARMLACLSAAAGSDVVILDEPSADMDGGAIAWLAGFVHELAARGVSVIIVTHDARILHLASRVVVIEDGQVVANESAPATALAIYRSRARGSRVETLSSRRVQS